MSIVIEERHVAKDNNVPCFHLLVKVHPSLVAPIDGDPDCTAANEIFSNINRRMLRDGYDTTFNPVDALPITKDFNYEGWEVSRETEATHLIVSGYGQKGDFKQRTLDMLSHCFNADGTTKCSTEDILDFPFDFYEEGEPKPI